MEQVMVSFHLYFTVADLSRLVGRQPRPSGPNQRNKRGGGEGADVLSLCTCWTNFNSLYAKKKTKKRTISSHLISINQSGAGQVSPGVSQSDELIIAVIGGFHVRLEQMMDFSSVKNWIPHQRLTRFGPNTLLSGQISIICEVIQKRLNWELKQDPRTCWWTPLQRVRPVLNATQTVFPNQLSRKHSLFPDHLNTTHPLWHCGEFRSIPDDFWKR